MSITREGLDETDLHADLDFTLVDRSATFINAGFPVNFGRQICSIPGRFIQPTPVMMCGAAVQARRALERRARGKITLDPALCNWLDTAFPALLGKDAHLLDPPADEAW